MTAPALVLPDEAATRALGARLAATCPRRAIVLLDGDLGAGKTTLARALLRELGVEGPVRSPTYTLVERYPTAVGEVVHMDLYRLAGAAELDFLGLDELHETAALWLVEWGERGEGALPPADLRVLLTVRDAGRSARLEALSPVGRAWLDRIQKRFS